MAVRAILMAFSLASAPPVVKKNVSMSPGVSSARVCPRRARASVADCGYAKMSPSRASFMAAITFGCEWPMSTLMSVLLKSM